MRFGSARPLFRPAALWLAELKTLRHSVHSNSCQKGNCAYPPSNFAESFDHREWIRSALTKVHAPREQTHNGFRGLGYLQIGRRAAFRQKTAKGGEPSFLLGTGTNKCAKRRRNASGSDRIEWRVGGLGFAPPPDMSVQEPA
jgi:hypothetical protein